MKRVILLASLSTMGTAIAATPLAAPIVPSVGCYSTIVDQAAPLTAGPYYLADAFCPPRLDSSGTISAPSISPDGRHYFIVGYDSLWIGAIGSTAAPRVINSQLTVAALGYSEAPPFMWASNSKAILGVRQDTAQPSNFALGPLAPIEIPIAGKLRALPPLKARAGGFDGVRWVGSGGLAVAEFGTKGDYYRPEHNDPTPTLAIVDGRKGKVLQTIPMPLFRGERLSTRLGEIDARLDQHGKVFALFVVDGDHWFEWRQGNLPRETSLHPEPIGSWKFALSPDNKTVLIAHGLSATGIICEHYNSLPRRPECELRTPQSGAIVDLWNIGTGKKLWSVKGTAYNFSRFNVPAISPDGRYALITMPVGKKSYRETIALISMADGHEIQRFNKPEAYEFAMRFGPDSHSFSIDGSLAILTYRVREHHITPPRSK